MANQTRGSTALGVLALGITAHDLTCQEGETITAVLHRLRRQYPAITWFAIFYLVAHVGEWFDKIGRPEFDLLSYGLHWRRGPRR